MALKKVRGELAFMNESGVRSLNGGIEEITTLHRLGLAPELSLSFSTVNVIESIQAHIGRLYYHVDSIPGFTPRCEATDRARPQAPSHTANQDSP